MKAFETHQRIFQLMCIFPMTADIELWKQLLVKIFAVTLHITEILGLVTSLMFVGKYATSDLEGSVKTLFQIAAYSNVIFVMVVAFIKRSQIVNFIQTYQIIYDTSKFWFIKVKNFFRKTVQIWVVFFTYSVLQPSNQL